METALQHEETTQCIGLPPTCTGSRRPDEPEASHALTIKPDHLPGGDQEVVRKTTPTQTQCSRDYVIGGRNTTRTYPRRIGVEGPVILFSVSIGLHDHPEGFRLSFLAGKTRIVFQDRGAFFEGVASHRF